jgi:Tfp pilus assembly protein PilF
MLKLYLPIERLRFLSAAAVVLIWAFGNTVQAIPFLPASPDEILERLPVGGSTSNSELRQLQRQLDNDSKNLQLATNIATRLLEKARAEADPRYYGYAQSALSYWWRQAQPPPSVLILRATLRQHQHDFAGALADLQSILEREPRNAKAWLIRAVILGVQGQYPEAWRSCMLLKRLSNRLAAATCIGNINSLSGHATQGYQLLRETLEGAASPGKQEQLWTLTVLAEISARLGDEQNADRYFQQALALKERDVYLLGAYADFLLDQNRPREVITLLREDTRPDGLLLRLALAEQVTGSSALAQHIAEIQSRIAAYRLRGDDIHQREEARFYLHLLNQPRQALRLAQLNWEVQHEPWDARLVLESALASGDFTAARPVLEWLTQTKLEDIQLQRLVPQLEPR